MVPKPLARSLQMFLHTQNAALRRKVDQLTEMLKLRNTRCVCGASVSMPAFSVDEAPPTSAASVAPAHVVELSAHKNASPAVSAGAPVAADAAAFSMPASTSVMPP